MRRGNVQMLEAIVLRKLDYGEADQIIGLLTEKYGKLSAFASGAKKSTKRFGPGLDLFSRVIAELRPPAGQSSLWRLASIDLQDLHMGIRDSLVRFASATYFSDCLWSLVPMGEPQPILFNWWKKTLHSLADLSQPFVINPQIDLELLKLCGYGPSWENCMECGGEPKGEQIFFSFSRGGISCEKCKKEGEGKWISREVAKKITSRESMSLVENQMVQRTVDAFFSYTLGNQPKSQQFRSEVYRGTSSIV